jgi:peptidoglycan hydrolase-like protein with peptidoglycan-binding domain
MPTIPLSLGSYGAAVARLQEFLCQQGVNLPASEVDRAFFGPATRHAVWEFQKKAGLPVTGLVDERTYSLTITESPTSRSILQQIPTTAVMPPISDLANMPAPRESDKVESGTDVESGQRFSATLREGWFPRILAPLICILAGIAFRSLQRRKGPQRLGTNRR